VLQSTKSLIGENLESPSFALRYFSKIVILALAGLVTVFNGAIFHFRSDVATGIVFFALAIVLLFALEQCFPIAYSSSGNGAHKP
jgi:hypothetical protein